MNMIRWLGIALCIPIFTMGFNSWTCSTLDQVVFKKDTIIFILKLYWTIWEIIPLKYYVLLLYRSFIISLIIIIIKISCESQWDNKCLQNCRSNPINTCELETSLKQIKCSVLMVVIYKTVGSSACCMLDVCVPCWNIMTSNIVFNETECISHNRTQLFFVQKRALLTKVYCSRAKVAFMPGWLHQVRPEEYFIEYWLRALLAFILSCNNFMTIAVYCSAKSRVHVPFH